MGYMTADIWDDPQQALRHQVSGTYNWNNGGFDENSPEDAEASRATGVVMHDPSGRPFRIDDIPDGVSQMSAYVRAASGGIGDGTNEGGFGASAHIQFTVTPGETLTLVVGAPGGDAAAQSFCGGGGGGASAIARAGFVPLAVMGGGGGGGSYDANHSVSDASLTPTGNAGDGSDAARRARVAARADAVPLVSRIAA